MDEVSSSSTYFAFFPLLSELFRVVLSSSLESEFEFGGNMRTEADGFLWVDV